MIELVTTAGRNICVNPMTGVEERALLLAAKATQKSSNTASNLVLQELIQSLVVRAEPEIDFNKMITGEEFDILYLLRLVSLGPIYQFRYKCLDCQRAKDYNVDIRKMRRTPLTIQGEADDPGLELLKNYDIKEICKEGILTADFTSLNSDRANERHQYKFILPVTGDEVVCELPRVPAKEAMESWMEQEDPRILSKQLAHMTVRLNGEFEKSSMSKEYDKRTTMERLWLRDRLADVMPGVETSLEIKCGNRECRTVGEAHVDIAGNFFLPKRAILMDWSGSYLASALAIGDGTPLQSWISPL